MSKRTAALATALTVLISQTGCYHTRVITSAPPEGPEFSDRQWFTLGGLVPLSSAAGRECRGGLARADSRMSGTDWLIGVGVGFVGGLIGASACAGEDPVVRGSCASTGATLSTFLLGSRTVEYVCAAEAEAPRAYYPPPPPPGYAPPPPAPQPAPQQVP